MSSFVVWLLISISSGYDNMGNTTNLGKFKTKEDCQAVQAQLKTASDSVRAICAEAKIYR